MRSGMDSNRQKGSLALLQPRILVLAPHDPVADPRIGWVTQLCAELARTDVLGAVYQTDLPVREDDGRVSLERWPVAHPSSSWALHLAAKLGTLKQTGQFRKRQVDLLENHFEALGNLPHPRVADDRPLRSLSHGMGGGLHALAYYFAHRAIAKSLIHRLQAVSHIPRLIVCHDIGALIPAIHLKRRHGCKVIYDSHECWPECDLLGPRWSYRFWVHYERHYISQADAVITVSPPLTDHLQSLHDLKRVTCVPNWTPRESVREPSCFRAVPYPVRFLLQGGAAPGRGIEMLLSTWSRLADPRAVLHLRCPQWEYVDQLRARYSEAVKAGNIVFMPAVKESELVQAATFADVGVIPYPPHNINHLMCCPNKLSQYMNAGLAILATETQFVGQQLRQADCGLTYDAFRAESLAKQIQTMCDDTVRLQQMKRNAYNHGQEHCTWEAVSGRYRDIVKELFCSTDDPVSVAMSLGDSLPAEPTDRVIALPWIAVRIILFLAIIGRRFMHCIIAAFCWVWGLPSPGQIQPSIYAGPSGGIRIVLHAVALSRLLLGTSLLRRSIYWGWRHGIARPVIRDLLRLHAMHRLTSSSADSQPSCVIRCSIEDHVIRFFSTLSDEFSSGSHLPPPIDWSAVKYELAEGRIRAIQWDHSNVTKALCYSRGSCHLGDLWLPGGNVYHLEALRVLGQTHADLVIALLQEPTVCVSGIRQPLQLDREPESDKPSAANASPRALVQSH